MKIILPIPPSINRTYKTGNGRFYCSQEATAFKEEVGWQLKHCNVPPLGKLGMIIGYYFVDERRDIDSGCKILLDSLQGHLYKNDKQVKAKLEFVYVDKQNPRCEIEVVPLEDFVRSLAKLK